MNESIASIAQLIECPKRVERALHRSTEESEHVRLDLRLASDLPGRFVVFVRVLRAMNEHFSIGLRYSQPGFGEVVLLRVNGDHGSHKNPDGGRLISGPHLHSFRGAVRDAAPQAGAAARWAWPLPPENLSLPNAWRTFCAHTSVTSNTKIDRRIAKLYASTAQLALGTNP